MLINWLWFLDSRWFSSQWSTGPSFPCHHYCDFVMSSLLWLCHLSWNTWCSMISCSDILLCTMQRKSHFAVMVILCKEKVIPTVHCHCRFPTRSSQNNRIRHSRDNVFEKTGYLWAVQRLQYHSFFAIYERDVEGENWLDNKSWPCRFLIIYID